MENSSESQIPNPESTCDHHVYSNNDKILKKESSSSESGSERRKTLGPRREDDTTKQDIGICDSLKTKGKKSTTNQQWPTTSPNNGSDSLNNNVQNSPDVSTISSSSSAESASKRRLTLAPEHHIKYAANEEPSGMESGCNQISTSVNKNKQNPEENNDNVESSREKTSSAKWPIAMPRKKLNHSEKRRDSQSIEEVDGIQSANQLKESKSQNRDAEFNKKFPEQEAGLSQSIKEQSTEGKHVSQLKSSPSPYHQSKEDVSEQWKSAESFQRAQSRKFSSTDQTDYQSKYFETASKYNVEEPKPRRDSESHEDPLEQEGNPELEEELLEAVLDGEMETVKRLIEEGVSTEALSQIPGKEGLTPLLLASWCGEEKMVKFLLDSKANRKHLVNGLSAVHYAATGGHVKVLQVLWNNGFNIKYRSSGGPTPLQLAAENGNLEAVQWLVEKGASLYIKDKSGFTPEDLARNSGYKNVAKYLQEKREEMQMNDFTEKRELGKGTYGEVFLIKRKGKYIVLKSINLLGMPRKKLEYAHQEIKLLKSLSHPYIVSYVGGGFKGDFLYIQMEYCSGGDMYENIQKQKKNKTPFEEQQVVKWALGICLAIKYIHRRNILHRDIKPHNIFLTSDGVVKLGDFGLSKALEEDSVAVTSLGSPAYMSPEVFKGRPYDAAADMFSFGSVMFEMAALKGGWPYKKELEIPNFSEDYNNVVKSLLEKNPQKRPRAEELLMLPIFHDALELQVGQKDHHICELNQEIESLVQEIEGQLQVIDDLGDEIKRLKGEIECSWY